MNIDCFKNNLEKAQITLLWVVPGCIFPNSKSAFFSTFNLSNCLRQKKHQQGKQTVFDKEQNISLCNDLREYSPRSHHTDAKATGKKLQCCLLICSETANSSSYYIASAALLYVKLKEKGWSSTPSPSLKLAAELKIKWSVEYFLADMCNSACASNAFCGMH